VDNLDKDRATFESERNKVVVSVRGFHVSFAKPLLRISRDCRPQDGLLATFSAESKSVVSFFVAQPLPLVFQPMTLDKSECRAAT
jgi:hypothetical protein